MDSTTPASKTEAQAENSYSDTFPGLPNFAHFAQIPAILIIFIAPSNRNFAFILVGFIVALRYSVAVGIHGASSASTYLAIVSKSTTSVPNFSYQVLSISPFQAVLSVHSVSFS